MYIQSVHTYTSRFVLALLRLAPQRALGSLARSPGRAANLGRNSDYDFLLLLMILIMMVMITIIKTIIITTIIRSIISITIISIHINDRYYC